MAFSLNRIEIIGSLGKDAETRTTSTDLSITSFSVATENGYKDKNGEWQNTTTWHNVTAFKVPDFVKSALKKGAKVYVEGRLEVQDYEDKDGNKKRSVKIIASQIIPLDRRERGEQQEQQQSEPGAGMNPPGMTKQEEEDLPF
jgi:single-strand DNA-binding protein